MLGQIIPGYIREWEYNSGCYTCNYVSHLIVASREGGRGQSSRGPASLKFDSQCTGFRHSEHFINKYFVDKSKVFTILIKIDWSILEIYSQNMDQSILRV